MEPHAAINYLIPPPRYLWRWAEDGSAVEWEDGTTLCLWMELHALLHYLAPQGLPPLGSILLVLMACRKSAAAALESAQEFAAAATGGDKTPASALSLLRRLKAVLKVVENLPEDLRGGLPARAHLLTNLFEGISNRLSPADSAEVLAQTDTWGIPQLRARQPKPNGLALLRDLKAITAVHERYDLRNLETRLRTGLEFVEIRPAQLPEPPRVPGDSPLPLLRQLEEHSDRELAAIASVARRMVAMFSLPRPAGFPQELPVGGISDITNRGALDRLLPSELAADDLILMARLANNEALYFRRDSPPDEPSTERVILMDSGIHLWGLPRLYVLAAALGLQEGAEGRKGKSSGFGAQAGGGGGVSEDATVLRREGRLFNPLKLSTIAEVQACLQTLAPDPHAAPALSAFQPEPAAGRTMDVFFLTAPGWREPVRRALHDLACRVSAAGGRFHVITLSRTGALELSIHSPAGSRTVATGRIDPDIILNAPKSGHPAARKAKDLLSDLPALIRDLEFYKQYPLPFRFPATPVRMHQLLDFAHWRVGVDMHRRLMMWNPDLKNGAGEIAVNLPPARASHWQVGVSGEEWIVLCPANGPGFQARAVAIGMKNPTRREVTLDSSHPFPVWMKCQHSAAILGYSDKAEACSLEDGRRLDSFELPKSTPAASVIFDGRKLSLATSSPADRRQEPGHPGREPFHSAEEISRSMSFGPPETHGRDARASAFQQPPTLGTPVSVGFVASGTLIIRAQGGRWELAMPEFAFKTTVKTQLTAVRPFRRVSQDAEETADSVPAFYTAEWHPDCRMIFDTRGLLHLIFSDSQGHLEISLLCLLGQPVAAWTAHWPQPLTGNAEWFLKPPAGTSAPAAISALVPLMQRFAALARAAPAVQDWREPPEDAPA
ncbi:MAG: hypothetical protein V4726_23080 [Verrucomicrobiota bacterium]